MVGQVAAGQPVLADENIEEYVAGPRHSRRATTGEFVLRVRGDSMKDAGILDGDHVIVRRQETAADGEIVVALVGEEATVKRFFKEADHVRLQPENEAMEPIRSRDVRVLGRVVGVCRKVHERRARQRPALGAARSSARAGRHAPRRAPRRRVRRLRRRRGRRVPGLPTGRCAAPRTRAASAGLRHARAR